MIPRTRIFKSYALTVRLLGMVMGPGMDKYEPTRPREDYFLIRNTQQSDIYHSDRVWLIEEILCVSWSTIQSQKLRLHVYE